MRDAAIAAALVVLGLALRLAWASGFGLGDDPNFLYLIRLVLDYGQAHGSYAYRFTWWLPTAALSRAMGGVTETSFIAPITAASGLGIALVYAMGRSLWGRTGAVIAALLLIVPSTSPGPRCRRTTS